MKMNKPCASDIWSRSLVTPRAAYDAAMADRRTHYQVLGVDRGARADEVRAAYLRQARRFHPDVVGGDLADISEAEREMTMVNRAWEVLGDDSARRRYDLPLPAPPEPARPQPASSLDGERFDELSDFADIDHLDAALAGGRPIMGVARIVLRLAPLSFVVGLVVLILGAALQVSGIWNLGLAMLLISMVSFLLAPFLVMSSSARRPR